MDKVLAVIPARIGSTRLKDKMLIPIDNQPVICHTIERVAQCENVGRVVVCTDSEDIYEVVKEYFGFWSDVIPSLDYFSCETGCDRTSLTLLSHPQFKEGLSNDCILHVHGDEANINPKSLDKLIEHHIKTVPHASMTQLMTRTYAKDSNERASCKIDVDWSGVIKGFSRDENHFYTALGAFAFDPLALLAFHRFPIKEKEHQTKIEQYRLIEHGIVVKGFDAGLGDVKSAIDTLSDVERMKSLVKGY